MIKIVFVILPLIIILPIISIATTDSPMSLLEDRVKQAEELRRKLHQEIDINYSNRSSYILKIIPMPEDRHWLLAEIRQSKIPDVVEKKDNDNALDHTQKIDPLSEDA